MAQEILECTLPTNSFMDATPHRYVYAPFHPKWTQVLEGERVWVTKVWGVFLNQVISSVKSCIM